MIGLKSNHFSGQNLKKEALKIMPNKKMVDIRDEADVYNAEQGLVWLAEEMFIFKDDPVQQEEIMQKLDKITYLIIEVENV